MMWREGNVAMKSAMAHASARPAASRNVAARRTEVACRMGCLSCRAHQCERPSWPAAGGRRWASTAVLTSGNRHSHRRQGAAGIIFGKIVGIAVKYIETFCVILTVMAWPS